MTRRVLVPDQVDGEPPARGALLEFHGQTMGTTWQVKAIARRAVEADLQAGIQAQLDLVVAQMSHWDAGSDLCRFNRAAAGSWQRLPPAFFTVLSYALSVAADSGGAYDPAAGALVNLWGFGPGGGHDQAGFTIPEAAAIHALQGGAGWRDIELDVARSQARQPGGTWLDFSAVAKGHAVDLVAGYLQAQGIRDYLVEVGGELRGAGMKPDGEPWWVLLENPPYASDAPVGEILVALHGLSIATSGDYRRYFIEAGRVFPHTLDPRSGAPIDNRIASVTVVHQDCMAADAWSTALTVLGVEEGMRLADARQLAARFLVRDARDGQLREHCSRRFRDMLQ